MLRRRLTISGPLRALIGFGYLSTAKPVQGAETPSLPTIGHTGMQVNKPEYEVREYKGGELMACYAFANLSDSIEYVKDQRLEDYSKYVDYQVIMKTRVY